MLFSRLPLYLCQKKFPHQEIEKLSKSVKWAKVKAIALSLWILVNCIFLKTKCVNSVNCLNKVLCFLSIEVSSQILDKIWKNFMWSLKSLPRPPLRKCDLQKVTVRAGFSCRKEGMIQCEKLQICWGKELHESSEFLEFIWFILLGSVSIAWLHVFSNLPQRLSTPLVHRAPLETSRNASKSNMFMTSPNFTMKHHEMTFKSWPEEHGHNTNAEMWAMNKSRVSLLVPLFHVCKESLRSMALSCYKERWLWWQHIIFVSPASHLDSRHSGTDQNDTTIHLWWSFNVWEKSWIFHQI